MKVFNGNVSKRMLSGLNGVNGLIWLKGLVAWALMAVMGWCSGAHADEVSVAVAANFSLPMQKIAAQFERDSGHRVLATSGSTGQFYAQIKAGAPYQVLLAADESTPVKLEQEGLAIGGSRFTYARGKLVLWSAKAGLVDAQGEVLKTRKGNDGSPLDKQDKSAKLAIADPKLAPYGQAAVQTLTRLGLMETWKSQLVMGVNIGQTHQFVATENAAMGFVALSQVWKEGQLSEGSVWWVPPSLYDPLLQDAVLLRAGQGKVGAQAFLDFLRTDKAKQIMRGFGYD